MTTKPIVETARDVVFEDQVTGKASRRLIPFLFVLLFFCYLDRNNIGFAALSMNKELGLTATMFGFAGSLFFVGTVCCEIPSNLMLNRFGARKWIARIMVTWGIVSTACMFAHGARTLYVLRLLLGMSEAGFLPGIMLFFTFWFPYSYRARVTALFLLAQPVTMAVGASISGIVLDQAHGILGLSGWRWLFFIEGVPSILLGVVTFFYLNDSPAQAKWLTDAERSALQRRLEREQVPPTEKKVLREVFSYKLLLLAVMYFGMMTGMGTVSIWAPQIVRDVLKGYSLTAIGYFTAIPPLFGAIISVAWGTHSDKRMERTYHYMVCMLLAAAGWLLVVFMHASQLRMVGLVFASVGIYAGQVIFWALAPQVISPKARPVGIAFIYSFGPIASILQFTIMGVLRDFTHNWAAGLLYVAVMQFAAAVLVVVVSRTAAPQLAAAAGAGSE